MFSSRFAGPLLRLLGRNGRGGAGRRAVATWSELRAGPSPRAMKRWLLLAGGASLGLVLTYQARMERRKGLGLGLGGSSIVPRLQAAEGEGSEEGGRRVSGWERRYRDFASLHYKGEGYMTAQDFLESLTQDAPRSHILEVLDDKLLKTMLSHTPSRSKSSRHLFRDIWSEGILTYGDYLFLVTTLIKTRRHFEVAFKMIDVDRSDYIDLEEFRKVEKAVTRERKTAHQMLPQSSLTVHLFGHKGRDRLYSKDFFKFIQNLQTEVQEIEFNKFSGGSPTITEEDFARILLRHTTWELEPVFERLRRRAPPTAKGINFQQYCNFCQLLNSLDDFSVAMTMFTIAGKPVTKDEFARAAQVCLGTSLEGSIVDTVYRIFDVDGDGKLSYREFLAVMKNWKLKGFKIRQKKAQGAWESFKTCIKLEMKNK